MSYPNARVNFGDVMQAIEDQLVLDLVVADRRLISWGSPDAVPQFAGPLDLLLIVRPGRHEGRDGGAAQLQMLRHVDVSIRRQAVADAGGGFKSWIKETFVIGDKVIDSVGDDEFWPEDGSGNLLTVESIKLVGDQPPEYPRKGSLFGDYVCTLACLYMPKINPSKTRT